MPTAQTKLEVCNLAMDVIREAPAPSLDTTSAPFRFILRNYDHAVDVSLRTYVWNFAKVRHLLNADGTAPLFKWTYRYKFPIKALRILPPVEYLSDGSSQLISHEIVGSYIETDFAAPLPVTAIERKENPGEWDPLFLEIVRCSLARMAANKFTSKTKYLELATMMMNAAAAKAEEIDTLEGSPEPIEQHDIIRVRQ